MFITGEYKDDDAIALIRAQNAHLAFIPSVWPETWCFALSRAWQAGLKVAAFDLGAQAERIAADRPRLDAAAGARPGRRQRRAAAACAPAAPSQSPPRTRNR